MAAEKASKKLQEHVKKQHGYPYDDAADLEHAQIEGWHKTKHAVEADEEHEALKPGGN